MARKIKNRNLVIDGTTPKYIRCYSNEGRKDETLDCITVVFTKKKMNGQFFYISASKTGSGVYTYGHSDVQIDRPSYGHLGRKIEFSELTKELQRQILPDYCLFWNCHNEVWGV